MPFTIVQAHAYWNETSGEYKHRILWPGEALQRHADWQVVNLQIYHPKFTAYALAADLLILHFLKEPEIQWVIGERKRRGKPTVYEIPDNFLSLGSFVAMNDPLRDPHRRAAVFRYAHQSDLVQFTTPELIEPFGFLNAERQVFRNHLPYQPPAPKPREAPFVFGWGGSHSHTDDLDHMAKVIETFCARHPDAIFSYMGKRENYERCFGAIPEVQRRFTPFGSIESYFDFISTLHVGIAILAPGEFSKCRSDVKYLEYGAYGAAPLLSRAPVYQPHGADGQRAGLFENPEQLLDHLEHLYAHPEACRNLAEAAHSYACTRTHEQRVHARHETYLALLEGQEPGPELKQPESAEDLLAKVLALAGIMGHGDHGRVLRWLEKLPTAWFEYPYVRFCYLKTRFLMGDQDLELLAEFVPVRNDIYQDRVFEILFQVAQRVSPNGAEGFRAAISDPARRLHLSDGPADLRRFREILKHNPYDFNALAGAATQLSQRRRVGQEALHAAALARMILPESSELKELLERIQSAMKQGRTSRER